MKVTNKKKEGSKLDRPLLILCMQNFKDERHWERDIVWHWT